MVKANRNLNTFIFGKFFENTIINGVFFSKEKTYLFIWYKDIKIEPIYGLNSMIGVNFVKPSSFYKLEYNEELFSIHEDKIELFIR